MIQAEAAGAYSWPTEWLVVYRQPGADRHPRGAVGSGIITGSARISADTGRVVVPVRLPSDPASAFVTWINEADIVRLTPPSQSAADTASSAAA